VARLTATLSCRAAMPARSAGGPATGVPSTQQRGAAGASAAAAAAAASSSEDDPLVLPLRKLLAVRRCAEPSLPEGAGIWLSTQAVPTVGGAAVVM
jgi:hypothetical protein